MVEPKTNQPSQEANITKTTDQRPIYLMNAERYSETLEKVKNSLNGKKLQMRDSEVEYGLDNALFSYNESTRGLSWQIPKIDEWTRNKDYLINAGTWRANKILGRGIDLNIEDHEGDLRDVEKTQSFMKEKLYNPLFNIFYLGYFHGGSAGLIIIKGQTDEQSLLRPLTEDSILKGDFLGIKPLTRLYNIQPCYEVQKVDGQRQDVMINKIGPSIGIYDASELGRPQFYRVSLNADLYGNGDMVKRDVKKATSFIVHRSHLLIYNSTPLSHIEERIEQFFGPSIAEKAYVSMRRYENLVDQISLLMDRTNIPVYKTKDLARASMQGERFQQDVAERIDGLEMSIAYGSMAVISEDEEFEFANSQFAEIPKLLTEYKKQLISAVSAPSSAVLNEYQADDEDMFNYSIEADCERFLRPFYETLIPLVYRSTQGKKIGEYSFTFKALEMPSEKEKAETIKIAGEIISNAWKDEVIDEASYHRMLLSAPHNISDMLNELNKDYMNHVKEHKGEGDNKYITYTTKRIQLAEALNRQNAYNIEASKEGGKEGGDPKATKKPTPSLNNKNRAK